MCVRAQVRDVREWPSNANNKMQVVFVRMHSKMACGPIGDVSGQAPIGAVAYSRLCVQCEHEITAFEFRLKTKQTI